MNSCDNCRYRHEKVVFPECAACLEQAAPDNSFPRWAPPFDSAQGTGVVA